MDMRACVLWVHYITHLRPLLPPGVMLSSSQGHSLLEEKSSGSHRAPYEVASFFTTYVKISESCVGAKSFNPNILVSKEIMEVLITKF